MVGAVLFGAGLGFGYALFDDRPSRRTPPAGPGTTAGEVGTSCQVTGLDTVAVPDLVGTPLPAAVAKARAGGLQVLGTGTPDGDPSGPTAVVRAQKPSPGFRVPAGACLGFRTGP